VKKVLIGLVFVSSTCFAALPGPWEPKRPSEATQGFIDFSTRNWLPNPEQTPGAIASTDKTEICDPEYPRHARVPLTFKDRVYARYGFNKWDCMSRGSCKIDHLVPLGLGGDNKITNLWPHAFGAEWNVYEKTTLEIRLRKEVCERGMNLEAAQQCFLTDWTACYEKFYPGLHEVNIRTRKPLSSNQDREED
jgi:hypothetical protein